jgi:hypothetical protein
LTYRDIVEVFHDDASSEQANHFYKEDGKMLGVDASQDCTSIANAMVSDGRQFVCRYYCNSGAKQLTSGELQNLHGAGLSVVVVWEDGRPTSASYFSYTKGVDDGSSAFNDALQIGQPAASPIYFAVDYDASDVDLGGLITDYLNGVALGIKTAANGAPEHPIGVYGSGATCRFALARGLATYTWLAMSSGWRGYDFPDWNIRQSAGTTYGIIDVDFDESAGIDFGAF